MLGPGTGHLRVRCSHEKEQAGGRSTETRLAACFTGAEAKRPSLGGAAEHVPPLLPLLVVAAGHTGAHQVGLLLLGAPWGA